MFDEFLSYFYCSFDIQLFRLGDEIIFHFQYKLILKFVMKEEDKDGFDYEEDVVKFKKVWDQIKQPNRKTVKPLQDKTQTATQTKINQETNKKTSKEKKTKVIVSNQNIKNVTRNPKPNVGDVIQVVTHPQRMYSNPLVNQRNNIAPERLILVNPQQQAVSDIQSLKQQIVSKDYELSLLRVSNTHNEDKIQRLQGIIEKKDQLIEELRNKQRELTSQLASLHSKDFNFSYGKVQYENYRHDSRRLLKMLKATAQYQKFADFALEDDGVRFLSNLNKTVKTKLDAPNGQNHFHFCTCNKEFIPEAFLWVPEKVYDFGKEFIKDRKGQLSQTELQLLLYQLNKLWRERQKSIINHVNALKANEVGRYQRKLQQVSRQPVKQRISRQ